MDPVLVLDADMTVAAARAAMALITPGTALVVRRRDPRTDYGTLLWYPLDQDDREQVMGTAIDPALPLGVSLDLHEHAACAVRQLTHPDVVGGFWTGLVVDGARAVGWMTANPHDNRGPERGLDFPMAPPTAGAAAPEAAPPEAAPTDVTAYTRVDVPEAVLPGAQFDVVVGLSLHAQPGVQGAVMHIAAQPEPGQPQELTVQVKAENFTLPNGVRYTVAFDPADLAAGVVRIPVTAPAVTELWRGRIEVEYSRNGLLIGTAWREVLVSQQAPVAAPLSTAGGELAVELDQTVPIDLTVSISRGQTDGTFLWTYTTPHPVPLPDVQVITKLADETAETLALRHVREMARVDGDPNAELRVLGVARVIADLLTQASFWPVLTAVWKIAHDAGRLPTLLLVSQESLIPWELASTEADYVIDPALPDPSVPLLLGTQLIIGRWRPAGPETPSGLRRPSTTPAQAMAVKGLAVVVGEFGPSSGFRSLKEAIEEGQQLKKDYQAAWIKGTAAEVATLLKGQSTVDGVPLEAQVLHVASHGEVDPDSPLNTGVILSDSAVRIDETIVIGSTFARSAAPLVFLNCCQLATDSGSSLIEGGLAAAFLQAGARAFIAPLWSIDDAIAKATALTFYAEALGKGRPVGEVMRELRARYTTEFPQHDQTTPLAYAYYGHPALTLTRQETH
ncbi:CHAT domain-containing protein [Micropruina sp.]|uniref:CHAT domain-containing protein n=1 Tax=Micropruina sp. TaxID=2737536 RepID=UPI0039E54E9E